MIQMKQFITLAVLLVILVAGLSVRSVITKDKVEEKIMPNQEQNNNQDGVQKDIFIGMHCDMIIGDDLSIPSVPTGVAAVPGDRVTWIARIPMVLGKDEYKFEWNIEGGVQMADAPNVVEARFSSTGPRTPSVKITKVETGQSTVLVCPTVNIVSTEWPST